MSQCSVFLIIASLLIFLSQALSSSGGNSLVWESLFPPPYSSIPATIILSLDCVSPNLCFVPGGSNGVGFLVYQFDGKMNGNFIPMNEPNMTLMIMDITMGGTEAAPVGSFGGVGFVVSAGLQYLYQGNEWLASTVPLQLVFETQSMRSTDDGMHITALDGGMTVSMYYSSNAGVSYTMLPINGLPVLKNCTSPMYTAMVSDKIWYITLGSFPQHRKNFAVSKDKTGTLARKNQRVSVAFNTTTKESKVHLHSRFRPEPELDTLDEYICVGYSAEIAKTVDSGQTWTPLFVLNSTFNFNMIDCASETACVAVGDGGASDDPAAYIYVTSNGVNFTQALKIPGTADEQVYLFAVKFRSATEVWVTGGYEVASGGQGTGEGIFYFSMDAGATWVKYPLLQPNIIQVMDIDFIDGEGFAAAMSEFQTSTILRYANQPFSGYFAQSDCPFPGCNFLCQNVTFPQGMCLPTQGGSAIATCDTSTLSFQQFETTSCVGSFTTSSQPLLQCLNSTSGGYFENYCNVKAPQRRVAESSAKNTIKFMK